MGAASSVADITTIREFPTLAALQPVQQRDREIGLQMALMKLVQHHRIHACQQWIGDQTACENAFGDKSKPGFGARDLFEANLIADRFSQLLTQFLCHAASRQSRGQPARLQHQYLSGYQRK